MAVHPRRGDEGGATFDELERGEAEREAPLGGWLRQVVDETLRRIGVALQALERQRTADAVPVPLRPGTGRGLPRGGLRPPPPAPGLAWRRVSSMTRRKMPSTAPTCRGSPAGLPHVPAGRDGRGKTGGPTRGFSGSSAAAR